MEGVFIMKKATRMAWSSFYCKNKYFFIFKQFQTLFLRFPCESRGEIPHFSRSAVCSWRLISPQGRSNKCFASHYIWIHSTLAPQSVFVFFQCLITWTYPQTPKETPWLAKPLQRPRQLILHSLLSFACERCRLRLAKQVSGVTHNNNDIWEWR